MEYAVAKPFQTANQRFGVGDTVRADDLGERVYALLAGGFIADPDAVKAPKVRLGQPIPEPPPA